jgi:iron complex outermembrane receptor protein
VWSEYVEAIIPFNDLAQLQAAVRHEDYGGGIGDTTDPKITGHLNLFSGVLGLRGSWGTSFQAPTLTQGATTNLLQYVNDPVVFGAGGLSCASSSTGVGTNVITTGGNLKTQSSENFDIGVDVRPEKAMNFSADLWHYDYSNLIAAGQNAQTIVSGECVNGRYVPDARVIRSPGGLLTQVTTSFTNVGKVVAQGLDLSASYSLALSRYGELSFRADATYVDKFDAYNAAGVVTHDAGSRNFNNNFAPMPHWRGNARAVWSMQAHALSLGVNYIGGYANDQDFNAPISSFTTVDLQYTLRLDKLLGDGRTTTFSIGANNIFDTDPPALRRYTSAGVLVTGPLAIDRPGYDALAGVNIQGRIIYARLKQNF